MLKGEVDIGIIPATITPITKVNVVYCWIFQRDTVGSYWRVRFRSHTSHSSSQIGYSWGDSSINGSRSEEINHFSLFNVGEIVGGIGISGYRSRNSHSPSNHSGDHSRSSRFIVMVITEVDVGITLANFLHITIVELTFPTQCLLKKIFQGFFMEKCTSK